jgi:hypothetical protein
MDMLSNYHSLENSDQRKSSHQSHKKWIGPGDTSRSQRGEPSKHANSLSYRLDDRSSSVRSEERAKRQIAQRPIVVDLNPGEKDTRSETSKSKFEWLKNKAFKWSESIDKTSIPSETLSLQEDNNANITTNFNVLRHSIADGSADISKIQHEYLAAVENLYQEYVEYPRHDDFRNFNKEAEVSAKNQDRRYRLMNEGLAFIALQKLKAIASPITDTSEFKTIRDLMLHQGSSKDDIEDIAKAKKELQKLTSEAMTPKTTKDLLAKVETCWGKIAGVIAQQISKANQRMTEIEEQLQEHGRMPDEYKEPIIHDIPSQARQRAEQARQRAEQARQCAEQGKEQAQKTTELTQRVTKLIEHNEKYTKDGKASIIDIAEVKNAANYGQEIAQLEQNIVEFAKLAAESAEARAIELENKTKDASIDNDSFLLKEEQNAWKCEKDSLSQAIKKQDEMIKSLELLRDGLQKMLDKGKQKESGGIGSSSSGSKSGDTDKIHLETFRSKREISLAIKDAQEKSEELKKILAEYDKVDKYYQVFDVKHANAEIVGRTKDKEILAMQARNLAEQHSELAGQAKDRAKQYEKRLKLLEASGADETVVQHAASCVRLAKQIAYSEQKIKDEYLVIAKRADDINQNANELEDSSPATLSLSTAQQKRLLSKIKLFYRQEREALKNIETAEKDLAKSARHDRDAFDQLRQHFEDILEFSTQNAKLTAHTGKIEDDLSKLLQDLRNSIRNSSLEKVADNNLRYVKYKMENVSEQAKEMLKKMSTISKDRDVQKITDLSVGHMIIDPEFSGMTMINGVCMYTREIRRFTCDKATGITTIIFREDIPEFTVFDQREYTKRVSSFEINTKNRTLSFRIPGNTYRRPGDDRTKCIIEENGERKEYDTKSLKKIVVSKHEKEEGDLEVSYRVEVKTMPDDTIKHDDKITCYSRESFANMHRFNLAANKYIAPDNQLTANLGDFDYTETRIDPQHGLILIGEGEYSQLCLKYVATLSNFINKLNEVEQTLKTKTINYEKDCIALLDQAIDFHDRNTAASALAMIEQNSGFLASNTSAMEYQLKRPPKRIEELKRQREAPNGILKRISLAHMESAEEMLTANNDLHHSLMKQVRSLLENGNDDNAKQKLLHDIHVAYHLDKNFGFPLLVDPTKGREIKCSSPNMLMLTEEYSMYMDKKNAKEGGLSEEEQQYVKEIEKFVSESDDDYLKNEIYLIKASSSGDLNQIFDALRNLNGGNRSQNHGSAASLQEVRQNAEYHLVDYLDKAIARATTEGIDGLIRGPLDIAKRMRQSRIETLKRVEQALNPDTPADVALRAINQKPEQLPSSLAIVKENEQDHNKKVQNLEDELDQLIREIGLKRSNPAEYAKESVNLAWKTANLSYQKLLDATHDPMAKKDFEARRIEITTEMAKESLTEYKAILQILTLKDQKKIMTDMMKWELAIVLFTNGQVRLNQFEGRIGNVFHRLISDLFKITGISK